MYGKQLTAEATQPWQRVTVALSKSQTGRPRPFTEGGFAAKLFVPSSFAARKHLIHHMVDGVGTGTLLSSLCLFQAILIFTFNLLCPRSGGRQLGLLARLPPGVASALVGIVTDCSETECWCPMQRLPLRRCLTMARDVSPQVSHLQTEGRGMSHATIIIGEYLPSLSF